MTETEEKALKAIEAELAGIPWGDPADTEASAPMPDEAVEEIVSAIREAGAKSRAEFARVVIQLLGQAAKAYAGIPG